MIKRIRHIDFLQNIYKTIIQSTLGASAYLVPAKYQSNFINLGGAYEAYYIIYRLISQFKKEGKVLVIGVAGGRDYYGMLLRGYDVYGFDIAIISDINKLVIGNVESPLPFRKYTFDVVIMGEVIEHLKYDANALQNIRHILKEDGVLIVTVPFYHDKPEYHLRVHSRKSCSRLLNSCGFDVINIVERPGFLKIPYWVNWLHHFLGWVYLKLSRKSLHQVLLPLWAQIEYYLGKKNIFFRKWSKSFGGYYACKKANGNLYDHISLNKNQFSTLVPR
ncbi:MAG: class I SAM-dependent methyltransferase [Deltaproteobacteria bacterium]|nr:class I SAM-dependent methyltransferase [Deltaproteobacteria bacterium]MBM4286866.1 class I SAM-dependent methyltransferase [Deltaproteobacteria bacterium]